MKYIFLFFGIIHLLLGDNLPLTFEPRISTNYYSSGSIYHFNKSGQTSITTLGLGARKTEGAFSITGLFQFTSAHNLSYKSTFFNPDLNIEMNRDYIETDNTWFESSNLKIAYKTNSFLASFGKYNQSWGHGKSSLVLSDNIPSYPQAGFSWRMSNALTLEYLIGSLSSQMIDSSSNLLYDNVGSRNTYYSRSIAAHRIVWTPSPSITFSAMETVIFGHRAIDVHYLMPFIPFWSMQHYTGDIDNIQMCGEIIWHFKKDIDLYGSLFIDEWRPEWTLDEKNRNWFGYQLGIVGHNILNNNDLIRIEYNWTDHRIYKHRFPINDSYSYDYSIGFWAGPHAEELYLSYKFNIKEFNILANISNVKRGEYSSQMLEDQYNNILNERFSGNTEKRLFANIIGEKPFLSNVDLIAPTRPSIISLGATISAPTSA